MAGPRRLVPRFVIVTLIALIVLTVPVLAAVVMALRIPETLLGPDLFLYQGLGGNSVVLYTPEGQLVIDPKFWKLGRRLQKAIGERSELPVRFVINTHHHWDHTHGNVFFSDVKPPVPTFVGALGMREHALEADGDFWRAGSHASALPGVEVEVRDHQIPVPGQLVHVLSLGSGHTSSDLVVYLPFHRVVVAGDLLFQGYFPTIDRAAGGSFIEWIGTLDRILALGAMKLVPGHGDVAEPADLKAFQGYLRDLVSEVSKLRTAGKTREQVIQEISLPVHQARMKDLFWYSSLPLNAGEVYDELEAGGVLPERLNQEVEASDGSLEEEDSASEPALAP